jgi:hypothetical protein
MEAKGLMRIGNQRVTLAGAFFTLGLAVYLVWGAQAWLQRNNVLQAPTLEDCRRNQIRTFQNLQAISRAQQAYLKLSREKLGTAGHAHFIAHLWIAVDDRGNRFPLDLIPRHLALAMGPSKAVAGYYFLDIHERFRFGDDRPRRIDYEREWALRAVPKDWRKSGDLVFLADESGKIFARWLRQQPVRFPSQPEQSGWIHLPSVDALKRFQQNSGRAEFIGSSGVLGASKP